MKYNKISTKLSMAALAAAMVAAPAVNVFAAPEDIIDTSKTATLTIHKYDMTAANEDGLDTEQFKEDGKKNTEAETQLAKYAIEGVEFTYQKVGNIVTHSEGGKIQVLYEIPTNLQTALKLTGGVDGNKYTSDQINEALKNLLVNNTEGKNVLEKYIETGAGKQAMEMTNAEGIATADNLPLGLYLVIESKVPANVHTTVDPFFVSLPMTDLEGSAWFYDVDVYPKNQTNIPDLDKLVRQHDDAALYQKPEYNDTATMSTGDQVDYILVSHLPKITSSATYLKEYTFEDKLTKGFTYMRDTAIYFYDNEDDAKANNTEKAVTTWASGSDNFLAEYKGGDGSAGNLKVSMTEKGLKEINPGLEGKWMVVSYSVTTNTNANPVLGDVGNTNDVKLTWRRTNMDKPDYLEDRARIYTYGINLKKQFQKGGVTNSGLGDCTKVRFSLYNKTDKHFVTATAAPTSGIYYITDSLKSQKEGEVKPTVTDQAATLDERALYEASNDNADQGTHFIPAKDGSLIINGLEADEYVLTELQTSDGFNLLKEPITINIKCTKDEFTPSKTTLYDKEDIEANKPNRVVIEVKKDRASATVDGKATNMISYETNVNDEPVTSNNAKVDMVITNTPGFKLPATGGAGTIAFTVAGCAVAFAGIALVTKKSKHNDDEK